MKTTKNITIFEGPDGGGKSTLASRYAFETKAMYVHFPQLPDVSEMLARCYIEAMMPALLGHQDVVLDRCWLSEKPYGDVFRNGEYRLQPNAENVLERLAMRCGAVVVMCMPEFKTVYSNWFHRQAIEMLNDETQLRLVYDEYGKVMTSLPHFTYDYKSEDFFDSRTVTPYRMRNHPLDVKASGNLYARKVVLVDWSYEPEVRDSFKSWPMCQVSNYGCKEYEDLASRTISSTDFAARMGEMQDDILWVDCNQDLSFIDDLPCEEIITLDVKSMEAATNYDLRMFNVAVEE